VKCNVYPEYREKALENREKGFLDEKCEGLNTGKSLRALVWESLQDFPEDETKASRIQAFRDYTGYLERSLGLSLVYFRSAVGYMDGMQIDWDQFLCGAYDLLVMGEIELTFLSRWLSVLFEQKVAVQEKTSLLVVREPVWPIHKILLLTQFNKNDEVATSWMARLTPACGATATILTIMPQLPASVRQPGYAQSGLDGFLSSNTTSGIWLRHLSERLQEDGIQGEICLRQGEPETEIQQELAESHYDLIVIGADPYHRPSHWILGGLVGSLLHWTQCPVLIAR